MVEIALGDENQRRPGGKLRQCLLHARQELDRVGEHLAAKLQDTADGEWRQVVAGDFLRRFQRRQDEALHAVAVSGHVSMFHRIEVPLHLVGRCEPGEKLRIGFEGAAEEGFVVPERVVGIEADEADRHGFLLLRRL